MGQWVSSHHNNVDEYVGSALPFVTGSVATARVDNADGAAKCIQFPYVTRWIVVINESASRVLRVGFTNNGHDANPVQNSNFFRIGTSQASPRLEVKCTKIFVGSEGGTGSVSVIAGYTTIPTKNFPELTGSDGFKGVG